MDIKSLNEYIKTGIDRGGDINLSIVNGVQLFDLFTSVFIYDPNVKLNEYIVTRDNEMRIDMIFKKIYNLESIEIELYLGDVDVILFINDISNPLNIKEGMVIKYPSLGDIDKFRVNNSDNDLSTENVRNKLSFLNKSTEQDVNRKKYIDGGYSLPPVVLNTPRSAVVIRDGKFSIGGV